MSHIFIGVNGIEYTCEWCQSSRTPKDRPDLCIIATCPKHGKTWHYRADAELLDAAPQLLEACEALVKGIRFLGDARAASDAMASEIEYDEMSDEWREYLEPCILEPYDQAVAAIAAAKGESE